MIHETWRALGFAESAAVHEEWIKTSVNYYGSEVMKMLNRGMAITAIDYINAHRPRKK